MEQEEDEPPSTSSWMFVCFFLVGFDSSQLNLSVDVCLAEGGKPISGGGPSAPAGIQRAGAASDEGRRRRAECTETTELPTAKQGA